MHQKDIVWVKVPYSNLEEEKIRPALVVSNDDYNSRNMDIVICAVTSNLEEKPYSVLINQKNLSEGKLPISSKIKADKIMQIEKTKIIKPFAKLNNQTFQLVVNEIVNLVRSK